MGSAIDNFSCAPEYSSEQVGRKRIPQIARIIVSSSQPMEYRPAHAGQDNGLPAEILDEILIGSSWR
jgi:hypothetical protein